MDQTMQLDGSTRRYKKSTKGNLIKNQKCMRIDILWSHYRESDVTHLVAGEENKSCFSSMWLQKFIEWSFSELLDM